MKQLSSSLSFFIKNYILFFAIALTCIAISVSLEDSGIGNKIAFILLTLFIYYLHFATKPWLIGKLYQSKQEFVFVLKNKENKIKFNQVTRVEQPWGFKFTAIKIYYKDLNEESCISFIPSQSQALFSLFRHPMVKELREELKLKNWY